MCLCTPLCEHLGEKVDYYRIKRRLLALHKWICNIAAATWPASFRFPSEAPQSLSWLMVFEEVFGAGFMCDISHRALWKFARYVKYLWYTCIGTEDIRKDRKNTTSCWNQSQNVYKFFMDLSVLCVQCEHVWMHSACVPLHMNMLVCMNGNLCAWRAVNGGTCCIHLYKKAPVISSDCHC